MATYAHGNFEQIASAIGMEVGQIAKHENRFEAAAYWYRLDRRRPTRITPSKSREKLDRITKAARRLLTSLLGSRQEWDWKNLFGGSRRKIAKKIAKNKRCYGNTPYDPAQGCSPPPTPLIYWGDLSVTGNGDLPLTTQRRVESIASKSTEKLMTSILVRSGMSGPLLEACGDCRVIAFHQFRSGLAEVPAAAERG